MSSETLSAFEEARGSMTRYLKRRATSRDAIDVLVHVYEAVRRSGQIGDIMSRYHPDTRGLEFR